MFCHALTRRALVHEHPLFSDVQLDDTFSQAIFFTLAAPLPTHVPPTIAWTHFRVAHHLLCCAQKKATRPGFLLSSFLHNFPISRLLHSFAFRRFPILRPAHETRPAFLTLRLHKPLALIHWQNVLLVLALASRCHALMYKVAICHPST
jgi:hypothetical protein